MRARYILSQWWTCLWLAACALCLAACGREAGTFSVSFGFADDKPDPETQYAVYVRVKDEHWTTKAPSSRWGQQPMQYVSLTTKQDSAWLRWGGALSDTWTWNGAAWTRVSETGPPGNRRALMYDSARKRMILVADGKSFTWEDNIWQPLAAISSTAPNFRVSALNFDRARGRGVLAGDTHPDGGGTVTPLAFEWDGLSWQSRAPLSGLLAYDSHRRRLVHVNDESFPRSAVLSDVETADAHVLEVQTAPVLRDSALSYDEERRQLLLVGLSATERNDMETWLWSSFEPAHQVMVDLKPLFGTGRTTDVVLDGFAFRSTSGASAATEDVSNPGVALELWNGRAFERVQENDADVDTAGELCFESHDPATLGALEVGKRWPFVLRPAADSDGPEPPQLRTSAFEVRVRYHLRGAAPALPPEPGSTGKRCASDSWALRDTQRTGAMP